MGESRFCRCYDLLQEQEHPSNSEGKETMKEHNRSPLKIIVLVSDKLSELIIKPASYDHMSLFFQQTTSQSHPFFLQ